MSDKTDKQKQSEDIAEKNFELDKKNKSKTDKDLETVHDQINDTFNEGTIDQKEQNKNEKKHK
ncbi:YozQ family protein [Fictibacillus phosphorivorans]|uniref:Uncharacterized protein n=1 Tax=Fictibacillus phosphorivorans TaxID=1221500 RepID=A0A160IRH5_9BACL|nr:DUF4025 domain-containing protein [Fictibacillus phosphorivorans]ANC79121.1 hypothetical protein ABE65_020855 [Fictibacillus phosphorivorans]MQR94147.1 DUF4025 domain-containing protein [Fictibacillus phosphorivorans]